MRSPRTFQWCWLLLVLGACSDDGPAEANDTEQASTETEMAPLVCGAGEITWPDRCDDGQGSYRFEPAEPIDQDNVLYFGSGYQTLELPEPPKSGFRLMLTEVTLEPFEERFYCHSWPLPELKHRQIYTTVLRNTPGLHHANMFAVPFTEGPSRYPECNSPANDLIKDNIFSVLSGDLSNLQVPDVLFANSTQVIGGETVSFPDGYANPLRTEGEIVIDTHLFNPTDKPLTVEVAWDFYTVDASMVENLVGASVYLWTDFRLEPQVATTLPASCEWGGGDVLGIMPHMHEWATGYDVRFKDASGAVVSNPYSVTGGLPESWIEMFPEPLSSESVDQVEFDCTYFNTTEHPMCNGVGENEMCFLFAYVSPPEASRYGIIPTDAGAGGEAPPCWVLDPREPESFPSQAELLAGLSPEGQARLLSLGSIDPDAGSTCPEESPGCYGPACGS